MRREADEINLVWHALADLSEGQLDMRDQPTVSLSELAENLYNICEQAVRMTASTPQFQETYEMDA